MKDKGLVVLLVLIVVSICTGLSIIGYKKYLDYRYEKRISYLEKQASVWVENNMDLFIESGNTFLNINQLVNSGLIDAKDLIDPRTGNNIIGCISINYDKQNNLFSYSFRKINNS